MLPTNTAGAFAPPPWAHDAFSRLRSCKTMPPRTTVAATDIPTEIIALGRCPSIVLKPIVHSSALSVVIDSKASRWLRPHFARLVPRSLTRALRKRPRLRPALTNRKCAGHLATGITQRAFFADAIVALRQGRLLELPAMIGGSLNEPIGRRDAHRLIGP